MRNKLIIGSMSIVIDDDRNYTPDLEFVKTRLAHKIHECDRLEGEIGTIRQHIRLKDKVIQTLQFEKRSLLDQKGDLELCILELKEQATLCASVDRANRLVEELQTICREQKRQRI